jgi:MFS family permease
VFSILAFCRSHVLMRLLKAVFCVGSALQTWARSLTQLTGGRAIGGIGVGALRCGLPGLRSLTYSMDHLAHSTLSPLYMAEISPPEVRGSLLALEQFSIVLGCVLGFWTGFLTRNSKSVRLSLSWSTNYDLCCSSRESVLANTPGLAAHPWDPSWFGGLRAA